MPNEIASAVKPAPGRPKTQSQSVKRILIFLAEIVGNALTFNPNLSLKDLTLLIKECEEPQHNYF